MKAIRLFVAFSAVLLLVLAPAAAGAQPSGSPCAPGGPNNSNNPNQSQYPPQECGLRLGQSQARPGEQVSVAGEGYRSNSNVEIEFRSAPQNVGAATTNAAGAFSTTIRIPADASPGRHTIAGLGTAPDGRARELTAEITIVAAASAARSGTLPRTGASTAPIAFGGLALVAVGAAAVVVARRRTAA